MNNSSSLKQNRIFKLEDGRELTTIPIAENTWSVIDAPKIIQLTETELMKAEFCKYDLCKVLKVKESLLEGLTIVQISKAKICARSTVYTYLEILEITLVKDTKKQSKYIQNTELSSCVLSMLLIDSEMYLRTPILHYFALMLLFAAVFSYLKQKYGKNYTPPHEEEISKLYLQITRVWDFTYRREPIIANSKREGRYYKKILKHYNNQGRDVFIIERILGESPNSHFNRKEKFAALYESTNADMIEFGRNSSTKNWNRIKNEGLLHYLDNPKGYNWEKSKEFLTKSVQYLIDNPTPFLGDRAKEKFIESLIKRQDNINDLELILDADQLEPEIEPYKI